MDNRIVDLDMIGLMKKAKDALDGPVSSMAFMKHR